MIGYSAPEIHRLLIKLVQRHLPESGLDRFQLRERQGEREIAQSV
jgi:hypothetical protein